MEILLILIGISVPIAFYVWRESRHNNPASRWPELAKIIEFQFTANPPAMTGQWKNRQMAFTAHPESMVLTSPLQCRTNIRIEIGPRQEVEQAAGMVVPDRVDFGDKAFDTRYMVRSTPLEFGQSAVDPAMRQRLLQLPDLRILVLHNKIDIQVPELSEASQVRSYCDVASSLADTVDGQ
ncbi:MAG: hypothetical protein ABIJ96_11415 [Elusimicrobiota bacterium]